LAHLIIKNQDDFLEINERFFLNKPVRSSTNVCVSILFFDDAKFDDNAVIIGDGSKPAFNIFRRFNLN